MGTLAHAGRPLAVEAAADVADNRPFRHQFNAGTDDTIGRGRCDHTDFRDRVESQGKDRGTVHKLSRLLPVNR